MRWRQVLELVDEEMSGGRLCGAPSDRIAKQQFERTINLFVEVDQFPITQDRSISLERLREALRVGNRGLDGARIGETQPDGRQPAM